MTALENFLEQIILKRVEGSVYLLPAICDYQIEEALEEEKNQGVKLPMHPVSGTVWVVQDTMNGMIAGMFDNQEKAIKYANGSANMAVTNMEVI